MQEINCSFSVLTSKQIEKIHNRSLDILEKIGVVIASKKARDIFEANGCKVVDNRVYINQQLMHKISQYKQKDLKLFSRTGNTVTFQKGKTHYHNSGTVAQIFNSISGEIRKAVKKDVIDLTRLLDGMEHIDTITPIVYPQDIDQKYSLLYSIKETIKHTAKPVCGPGINNLKEAKIVSEMFDVMATSDFRPTLCMACSPVSPLTIPEGDADALMYLVKKGFPVKALPCPIVGMTAPMSLLGAITQNNAEVLAILALARLVNPEAIVAYGGRLVIANMSAMNTLGGVPEDTIVDICAVQMAHHYHLVSNVYGTGTCAFAPDTQMGFEKGIKGTLSTISGCMWQSGIGSVCDAIAVSYEQIVIDNELVGNIYHSLAQLAADDDFGFEAIQYAMEKNGSYLTHSSAIKYARSPEKYIINGKLSNYQSYEKWASSGRKNIADKATNLIEQLLKRHEVLPMDQQMANEIDKIYDQAVS